MKQINNTVNTVKIIPSIIADTPAALRTVLDKIGNITDTFQLDIMDNKFVPASSLDFNPNRFELPENKVFEAHLMVDNPDKWIEKLAKIKNIKTFIAHIESCDDPKNTIAIAKKFNKRIGFALNPKTSINRIKRLLPDIDHVLVLTVEPGRYGSEFLPDTLKKVRQLRKLAPNLNIEVDGGIDDKTIISAKAAGANLFVSGSFIIKAANPKKALAELKKGV
ncbi:ribulose-phosphate 3-epimerase [Candidatus Woesearchaeota archaeon]|nr:ribulose-phosphate 3-epimerase [Candidatus Woesearchaeota archaeon]